MLLQLDKRRETLYDEEVNFKLEVMMRKIGLATTIIFLIALLVSCVGLSGCGGNGNGDGNGGGTITELPGTY